ncbi:retrotransposon protein, putative, ty3-gypsy subclass, partial [Tanacetum coccineum]
GNRNNKQHTTRGRVSALTTNQAANAPGTVSGTLYMYDRDVFVLFDTGVTHYVLSLTFSKTIKVLSTPLDFVLSISTPMGNNVVLSLEFRSCPLSFDDKIHFANLLPLEMSDFDIILGMDWLTEHRATIDCHTKRVIFGDLNNPEFIYQISRPIQRAVDALLHGLTTRLTNEIRQNGAGGSGDQPPTIHIWLERFGKHKPRSFSTATTPVDAENLIAYIEKIFEVLGCADEFKARLASYKLEGDALNWWKAFKQAKEGLSNKSMRGSTTRFVKEMERPVILDGIVNTEFTDVAQVANTARNIEIIRERSSHNNKRNRDEDRIRPTAQDSNQRGYDQKGYDGRSCDRQGGNSNQKSWQNRGQQYNCSSRSSGQKGYLDYASSPPCDTCGKLHPGKACHRVTGACFTCGSTSIWQGIALRMVETVVREMGTTINLLLRGEYFLRPRIRHLTLQVPFRELFLFLSTPLDFVLSISTPMGNNVVLSLEFRSCPLRFDDKIRFANLLPLEMSDFDIILGMDWLAEHRAPIVCYTNRVIFGDLNNPEFIYLFQFRGRSFLFIGEEL